MSSLFAFLVRSRFIQSSHFVLIILYLVSLSKILILYNTFQVLVHHLIVDFYIPIIVIESHTQVQSVPFENFPRTTTDSVDREKLDFPVSKRMFFPLRPTFS